MFSMLKNLVKMITNKKVLVVLALVAVVGGTYLYMKSQKAVIVQDVDQQQDMEQEPALALTPEMVSEETKDLGQSPQVMPVDTTENFAPIA